MGFGRKTKRGPSLPFLIPLGNWKERFLTLNKRGSILKQEGFSGENQEGGFKQREGLMVRPVGFWDCGH